MTPLLAAFTAALASALALPSGGAPAPGRTRSEPREAAAPSDVGWLIRFRGVWAALAGAGAAVFVGGAVGTGIGVATAAGVWVYVGRVEPTGTRRRREATRRDLPHLVSLLASALTAGAAPGEAVRVVCRALPGPAADVLGGVAARLELGADPASVWAHLAHHRALAPLGRAMSRSYETGAPIVAAVDRLADELSRTARAETEDQARAVGVKAAVPLGLCLLPAFVLIGIVPLVAGLMSSLDW